MMPRPICRSIIDLAVEVLSSYLNSADELHRVRVALAQS
jgi:hypothetical protein